MPKSQDRFRSRRFVPGNMLFEALEDRMAAFMEVLAA